MTARRRDIDLANWPVAILAGGLATRLRPTTNKIPKGLVTVAGEPFLVHQLRLLRSEGFRKIVLCVGYLGELIEAKIGDGKRLDLQIDYSFDGPTPLGTSGALKGAISKLGEHFLVIYGDSYMPVDYAAIVEAFVLKEKPALAANFLLVVITNQPDVGRGTQSREAVEAMNLKMQSALPLLDRIEICYHAGERYGQPCGCRKPRPGLILRAAAELNIDAKRSYVIGDRWRDVDCARAAGCRAIFIERDYKESLREAPDFTVANFNEAVSVVFRDAGL